MSRFLLGFQPEVNICFAPLLRLPSYDRTNMVKRRYSNGLLDTPDGSAATSSQTMSLTSCSVFALERRVYGVEELPREVVKAIEKSEMDSCHSHLDALLDEK